MIGLKVADLVVILVYLFGITLLGIWTKKSIRSMSDFFMPRRFGKGMMMMHAFGTGTASDQAVIVAAGTFRHGLSGIWYQWLWLFNTPFYWLIAPIFRRFRVVTTADVYRLRFDQSVAVLFAIVGIVGLVVKIALMLKGAAALVDAGTAGGVTAEWAIPVLAVLFVVYGTAGGLSAAIVTDFIQGILTVIFSFLLLPFVLQAVGGMDGIRSTLNQPELLSLVAPKEIGIFYILMFSILSLTGIVAQPFIMGVCAAGRTEMDGRFGFVFGNLIKRICTIAWALTGLAALALFTSEGIAIDQIDPDRIYGQMAARFLPGFMPGLVGLFIATLLAGVMSSCDSFMVSGSALFTENLYKPKVTGQSDRHYVMVGRIVCVAIVISSVLVAYSMPNVLAGLKTWLKIPALLGVAFWMGLIWRRFNVAGAWASTLIATLSWWVSIQPWFVDLIVGLPFSDSLQLVQVKKSHTALYEPWQIVFYLSLSVLAGIVASLLTAPPDEKLIRRFHYLISLPIEKNESQSAIESSANLDLIRPSIFKGTAFEIVKPSRTSVVGFAGCWCAVAVVIQGFRWLVG